MAFISFSSEYFSRKNISGKNKPLFSDNGTGSIVTIWFWLHNQITFSQTDNTNGALLLIVINPGMSFHGLVIRRFLIYLKSH